MFREIVMRGKSFEIYKAVHKQGFIPIFVKDDRDTDTLVEACVKAKLKVVEYTLRREDANTAIPRIIKEHPELHMLAGSVLDAPDVIRGLRGRATQLLTIDELAEAGVDGFISMFEFTPETLARYTDTHFMAPCAQTPNEALRMTRLGAHLIKMTGPDLSLVKRTRQAPSHGFAPIFITGGMTVERIPEAVEAGGICFASGFDLILKNAPADIDSDGMAEEILKFVDAVDAARRRIHPEMMRETTSDDEAWLDSLPHYHPFSLLDP
jgi:2-keto-3-deoxy-6-phosphogluconate aldolase